MEPFLGAMDALARSGAPRQGGAGGGARQCARRASGDAQCAGELALPRRRADRARRPRMAKTLGRIHAEHGNRCSRPDVDAPVEAATRRALCLRPCRIRTTRSASTAVASTNDTVVALANGADGARGDLRGNPRRPRRFARPRSRPCASASPSPSRATASGATWLQCARRRGERRRRENRCARSVVCPPRRSRVFGHDPNWGRLAQRGTAASSSTSLELDASGRTNADASGLPLEYDEKFVGRVPSRGPRRSARDGGGGGRRAGGASPRSEGVAWGADG